MGLGGERGAVEQQGVDEEGGAELRGLALGPCKAEMGLREGETAPKRASSCDVPSISI